MKILFSTLIIALISLASTAQEALTLEDAIMGRYGKFRMTGPSQLSWIPNQNYISWVTKDTVNPTLVKRNLVDKSTTDVCSLDDLKKTDFLFEIKRFPRIKWINDNHFKFNYKKTTYSYNTETKAVDLLYTIPEGAENIDVASNNALAYTRENNLYIWENEKEIAVSSEENKGIVFGQSVHRFEFGISKGTFWSPKNNYLAFYRKDESMVTDYPLVNYTERPALPAPVKYPMAGMKSHEVTIGIYVKELGGVIYLKTEGPKDQYLTNIAWGPDEKYIYVAVLNRDQNHVKLNQYLVEDGTLVKTILEEKHDKYVQPLHPMKFIPESADKFIWQSEKDGYNQLYLYNTKGKLLRQLTKSKEVVTSIDHVDSKGNVIYTVASNNGLDRVNYRYSTSTKTSELISKESGVHRIKVSDDGSGIIDVFSNSSTPTTFILTDVNKKTDERLFENKSPYLNTQYRKAELGQIKAEDGSVLNYRMIKPYDFDANKKYKCLVYVYNGPGVQLITNSWGNAAPLWMQYQANKGYIIFTLDGRGSENRGRDFEQAVFRQLGELEVVDQLKGVEFLHSLDFIDKDKMAVHGWSYGGFMTTSLMLKAPGIFKVGVAGGPVIDWKYYEVMYTERYMDTPETNKEGYARASLLDKVEALKGKLLLIHGADDDVVVPQHSIDFLKQSVDKGVQVDFFIYPGHKHNVRGKDRIHLMQKVLTYIDDNIE